MASDSETSRRPATARKRIGLLVAAAFLGAVFALVAVLARHSLSQPDRLPPFDGQAFRESQERWRASGPEDYRVQISVSGRQPAVYEVEVRGGQPVNATRNGKPLRQQRTFGTWSVPGMFSTIAVDVETVERFEAGMARASDLQLQLRGVFHEELGYPIRYRRLEMVRFGNNRSVNWEVTSFEVLR